MTSAHLNRVHHVEFAKFTVPFIAQVLCHSNKIYHTLWATSM